MATRAPSCKTFSTALRSRRPVLCLTAGSHCLGRREAGLQSKVVCASKLCCMTIPHFRHLLPTHLASLSSSFAFSTPAASASLAFTASTSFSIASLAAAASASVAVAVSITFFSSSLVLSRLDCSCCTSDSAAACTRQQQGRGSRVASAVSALQWCAGATLGS